MISNIGSNTTAGSAATTNPVTVQAPANPAAASATPAASSTVTISTLASQLAASAARAQVRDSTLTRTELGAKAKSILDKIIGDSYDLNRSKNDSEVPNTKDPALLERAKQATAYTQSNNQGGVKNPFAGLSGEQLSNIAYDDSGTYTVNERRAAYLESYDREETWRVQVCAQGMAEYNSTGKMTGFFTSVLDHYKGLPAIEQAQYPASYEADLTNKIKLDFNYRTNIAEGNSHKTLIDELLSAKPQIHPKPLQSEPKSAVENQLVAA